MGGDSRPRLFLRVLGLPAAFADTGAWHCVCVDPDLATWCNVRNAAFHPVRINFAANCTNSNLLLAFAAFVVCYIITTCDGP